jgi:hypothetical protein
MKGITVGRVFHAVLKQLDRTAPEKPRIAGNRLASVLALR